MITGVTDRGWIQVISATRRPVRTSRGVKPPKIFLGVKFDIKILSSISLPVSVAILYYSIKIILMSIINCFA